MANMTSASGTATFTGNWTKELFDQFMTIFDTHLGDSSDAEYTIVIDEENFEAKSARISGLGRNSFENNLRNMRWWAYDQTQRVKVPVKQFVSEWNDLAHQMHRNQCKIEVSYMDCLDGEGIYEETGTLLPRQLKEGEIPENVLATLEGELPSWSIDFTLLSSNKHEGTRKNFLKFGFYDEDDFEIKFDAVTDALWEQYDVKAEDLTSEQIAAINDELNENPFIDDVDDILGNLDFVLELDAVI